MNSNTKFIASSIVIAAIIIAGAIMYRPGARPAVQQPEVTRVTVSADDDAVLGSPAAPVTMVIFGDYQCPYCKRAADTAEAQVRTEYVKAGKVKIVFRDYPLDGIHPYAEPAAEAAQCAQAQGKYWEYHDALFARQSDLPTIDYIRLASDLGLETTSFKACLGGHTYAAEVAKDRKDGDALGVDGTPATFINGQRIAGAYPYETYKEAIELALKNAK